MQETTNYKLKKPDLTDVANITQLNANWDKLDTKIKILDDKIANPPSLLHHKVKPKRVLIMIKL